MKNCKNLQKKKYVTLTNKIHYNNFAHCNLIDYIKWGLCEMKSFYLKGYERNRH